MPSNPDSFLSFCAATGVRVPLSEHRQRQALPQPRPDGHQARHCPDRVHVLRAVPRHDQVSDYLCQRHSQCLAGMFQEDCRKRATPGNHVEFHIFIPALHHSTRRRDAAPKTLFRRSVVYLMILCNNLSFLHSGDENLVEESQWEVTELYLQN